MTKDISIKGIIIALIIALILDVISGVVAVFLFASDFTEEAILAIQNSSNLLIFALFASALSSIIGGYICAHYAKLAPYKNAAIFGGLGVAISSIFATFDPAWFDIAGFITTVPAALLGGYLHVKKNA